MKKSEKLRKRADSTRDSEYIENALHRLCSAKPLSEEENCALIREIQAGDEAKFTLYLHNCGTLRHFLNAIDLPGDEEFAPRHILHIACTGMYATMTKSQRELSKEGFLPLALRHMQQNVPFISDPSRRNVDIDIVLSRILSEVPPIKDLTHYVLREALLQGERQYAKLSPSDEEALLTLVRKGFHSESRLIRHNSRLIINIAKRLPDPENNGVLDKYTAGSIGLMIGARRFQEDRGYKMSTYVTWWIKHQIRRQINDLGHPIRIPVHTQDLWNTMRLAISKFATKNGREPSDDEIAELLDLGLSTVKNTRHAPRGRFSSLDVSMNDDDTGTTFVSNVEDKEAVNPELRLLNNPEYEVMSRVIRSETYPRIKRDIIESRFLSGREETLKEIGDRYNLSRERIRQLEADALDEIRKALVRAGFYTAEEAEKSRPTYLKAKTHKDRKRKARAKYRVKRTEAGKKPRRTSAATS